MVGGAVPSISLTVRLFERALNGSGRSFEKKMDRLRVQPTEKTRKTKIRQAVFSAVPTHPPESFELFEFLDAFAPIPWP